MGIRSTRPCLHALGDYATLVQVNIMTLTDLRDEEVSNAISLSWETRDGRVVPATEEVQFAAGVRLNATVLYADLSQSSRLATEIHQKTAARVIRGFLRCMSRLITEHQGTVTAFDGDRVMGVFVGDQKNTYATVCALKMNYAVTNIIGPRVSNHFASLRDAGFKISHAVGIDTSPVLAIRAGQRGSDDLVWVGRAPNLAARLSELREENYRSFISEDVFSVMLEPAKTHGGQLMWEKRGLSYLGEETSIYRSNWTWKP